jgi:hypothetical protein
MKTDDADEWSIQFTMDHLIHTLTLLTLLICSVSSFSLVRRDALLTLMATVAPTSQSDFLASLKNATSDMPRIPLSDDIKVNDIQGAVYLKNPRDVRLDPSDTILFTVKSGDAIVAGAKLPVRGRNLPLRFRLDERNNVPDAPPEAWQGDLTVQVTVCSDTADPCSNVRFQATGLAKLLRFSEQRTTVRAPVSLVLE